MKEGWCETHAAATNGDRAMALRNGESFVERMATGHVCGTGGFGAIAIAPAKERTEHIGHSCAALQDGSTVCWGKQTYSGSRERGPGYLEPPAAAKSSLGTLAWPHSWVLPAAAPGGGAGGGRSK